MRLISIASVAGLLLALSTPANALDGGVPCAYDEIYPHTDLLAESQFAGDAMCRPSSAEGRVTPSEAQVEAALESAEQAQAGMEALHLDVVAAAHPGLEDWVALRQGQDLLEANDPAAAEAAFLTAIASVDSDVRVQARLGRVIALLRSDDRDAEEHVRLLRYRYPDLPERPSLILEVAAYNRRRGDDSDAAQLYRSVMVRYPGTGAATEATEALAAMRAAGVEVRELSPIEVVERAERLFARGPLSEARTALEALEENPPGHPTLRAKAFALMAKLARHEGRFDDATRYYRASQRSGSFGDAEDIERRTGRATDVAEALNGTEDAARGRLRQLRAGRALSRVASPRLMSMVRVAARAGLEEETNAYLEQLAGRNLLATHRLSMVLHAMGTAEPDVLLRVLGEAHERAGSRGTKALYYRGRLLHRAGRLAEAEEALLAVRAADRSELTWYATWADQELAEVRGSMVAACTPNAECAPVETEDEEDASAEEAAPLMEGRATAPRDRTDAPSPDLKVLAERLDPIIEEHGEGFPWLARAASFLRIGEASHASRQLYEAYLAYREANGRAIRRCGLESVAMGKNRARTGVTFAQRQKRRGLDAESREELAAIAEELGAAGAATGFGGPSVIASRPRPYEHLVEAAAARHGLDPNLLFAVMRVESVYQEHIVSYAGAIGLAQIMPRTGALIAHELGREDYKGSDLLKPEVNLEFAAWYLRSLIDRWDGHLPLAIASYNGGPHNVRRWLRDYSPDLPMDAFLEHIPFTQTHRYVRRVLGHYEAYRAQEGLPMIRIDDRLPAASTDPIGF